MNLKNVKVFTSKFVGTGPTSYEKKNLPGRVLTKVEKRWSRVYVIRVHPKAEVGRRYLLRIFSKTAQCHRLPKKSEKKITFQHIYVDSDTYSVSK